MKVYKVIEIEYEPLENNIDKDAKFLGVASPQKIILYFDKSHKEFAEYERI